MQIYLELQNKTKFKAVQRGIVGSVTAELEGYITYTER